MSRKRVTKSYAPNYNDVNFDHRCPTKKTEPLVKLQNDVALIKTVENAPGALDVNAQNALPQWVHSDYRSLKHESFYTGSALIVEK